MATTDVAIIGAGPYGLSVASHLNARGIATRVQGRPMEFWSQHMPLGMVLKSQGFATNLSDPDGALTLEAYCQEHGLPYQPMGLPVPLETFINYGRAFQERFVPNLDQRHVRALERTEHGFRLRLSVDDRTIEARRVIVAVGVRHFAYLPPELNALTPTGLVSHSSQHGCLTWASGRSVAVVGAGSSATDLAAALHERGAKVTLIARRTKLRWIGAPTPLSPTQVFYRKLRAPVSGLGTDWRSLAACKAPMIFHAMPSKFRHFVARRHLGPAPGYAVRDVVDQHVEQILGADIVTAEQNASGIRLDLRQADRLRAVTVDHVVGATGYNVNLTRLEFLDSLLARINMFHFAPILSRQFESSVRGLYFVGISAAFSFGPMLRFVYGADWAARNLAVHLAHRR